MRAVIISDVHNKISEVKLPPGDLLIIAGDLTGMGTMKELLSFNSDLEDIKPLYKNGIVACFGNHDFLGEQDFGLAKSLLTNVNYLVQHEEVIINGIRFFCSAFTPEFFSWAFNVKRGPDLKAKWDQIPDGIDVLVTHGPPHGILDRTPRGEHAGCEELLIAVKRIKPKYHIFGHIHAGYGIKKIGETTFINASTCTERYKPINKPIEIDI